MQSLVNPSGYSAGRPKKTVAIGLNAHVRFVNCDFVGEIHDEKTVEVGSVRFIPREEKNLFQLVLNDCRDRSVHS